MARGADGPATAVQEIDPRALVPGANEVTLCVPDEATRTVTISDLRIVGEVASGRWLGRNARIGATAVDAAALVDRDPTTSAHVPAGDPIRIGFERLISPDAIVFHGGAVAAVRSLDCIDLQDKRRGLRMRAVDGASLSMVSIDGGSASCAAISLRLEGPASLDEIDVVGSGAAEPADWPEIVVTSAREHAGSRARISGFVRKPERMPGAIRVEIGGQRAESQPGVFDVGLSRDTDDSAAWPVDIVAHLPDGSTQQQHVVLARDARSRAPGAATDTGSTAAVAMTGVEVMFGRPDVAVAVRAPTAAATKVTLGSRVGLDIPAGAVTVPTMITARHLGDVELPPLDGNMVNVTAPKGHGYEFLPHGQKFRRKVEVTVPFDRSLLPDGTSVNDVRTYYFDPTTESWKPLDRTSIDLGQSVTKSATDHFTIMINAVLAAPNTPTTLGFDPTALSSIGAASPAVNIDLMPPPSAAPTGDAITSLPIRLPAGRGMFSPALSLTYASSSGNSWLGVGWDLPMSRIEVDTRWGTPRFTSDEDRYILDGAMLVPTTETEGPRCDDGQAGRRYRSRTEGAFVHILRCGPAAGGSPGYHWEVIDRDGTLRVYGEGAGPSGRASLASYRDASQIYRWFLARVVDVNGNTTQFTYAVDDIPGAGEYSREMYPTGIVYTAHPSGPPAAYSVELIRDDGTRPDRIVSGRAGFKMVTRHLLRQIRVKLGSTIIRDYVLSYYPGQFGKTVLASVREYGAGGCAAGVNAFVRPSCGTQEFHEHRFEYFRDVEGFETVQQAGIDAPYDVAALPLGAGAASNTTGGLFFKADITRAVSGGFSESLTTGSRDEIDGLYDLDGDGRPDQVYMEGSTVRALYNRAGPGALPATLFAPRTAAIDGLLGMAHENRLTLGVSHTGQVGPASSSASYASTATKSARFLTDADGDGFVDYLRAGFVDRGEPFTGGMRFSPTPYPANLGIDPTRDPVLAGFNANPAGQLIEGDPVISWTAPATGHVLVRGTATKQRAGGADGVVIELYHQDALQQQQVFAPSDTSPHDFPVLQGIDVTAGDELYVRLKTGPDPGIAPDGALLDAVDSRLLVTYDQICHLTCEPVVDPFRAREPTGEPILAFDSQSEFRIAGNPAYAIAPVDGTLALHTTLAKTPSAADLRACVQRYPRVTPSFTPTLDAPCDSTGTDATNVSGTLSFPAGQSLSHAFDLAIPVSFGDIVLVRVESDFSFDPAPGKLSLAPSTAGIPILAYTTVCTPDATGTSVCSSDPAEIADAQLSIASFGPSIALVEPPVEPLVAPLDTTLVFHPLALADDFILAIRSDLRGLVHQVDCRGLSCGTIALPAISVSAGESISFEIVGTHGLPAVFAVSGTYLSGGSFTATLHRRAADAGPRPPTPFVGGYRRFRATMWSEAEPFRPATLLADYAALGLLSETERERVVRTAIQPVAAFPPGSAAAAPAWAGPQSVAFVSATALSAGYLGVARPTGGESAGGLFTGGYSRLSGTQSLSFGTGIGIARKVYGAQLGLSLDFNVGLSWTKTTTDVVDLNGDGIIDVLAGDDTFLGDVGGAHPRVHVAGFETGDGFRQRTSLDYGLGLGGGVSTPVVNAAGRTISQDIKDRTLGPGFSQGTGYAIGRSEMTKDLQDVNGDGLPDVLRRSGTTLYVRYNLGNRFGEEDVLDHVRGVMLDDIDGFESLEDTTSLTNSTSDALSHDTTITTHETEDLDLFIYSRSKNSRQTSERRTRQIVDLNGDGLPDVLFKHANQPIYVQYNLGGSFADPIAWDTPDWGGVAIAPPLATAVSILGITGADVLAGSGSIKSTSTSQTLTIPIPYTPFSIGGNYATSHEVDNYELALVDLDGDGAPEHVLRRQTVSGTPTMYIKRNRATGRANLLSRVIRPLGSSFSIDYSRTENTVDLPHSRHVLTRVEVDDGTDLGAGYDSPNHVMAMAYADGFYSRHEKTFFGFGTVTTTRADGGNVTDIYENRTYPLHGRMIGETRRDGAGRMFRQHAITYSVLAVRGAGDTPLAADPTCLATLHPLLAFDACLPVFPVVTRDDDTRAEGGTLAKTHRVTDTAHDRFGNVLASLDEADDVIASDDVFAAAQYQNDTTRWILGRSTSLVVRAGSASGTLLRSRTGTYDGNGRPLTLSVDTGTGVATSQLGYDGVGNLSHVVTPPNEAGQIQTVDIAFDPTTRMYPSAVTDGFGLASSASYDLRFGVATLETDTHGAQRSQTLDGFGRVTQVYGPYDTSAPALAMSYFPGEVLPRAVTVTRASAPADYTGPVPAPITTVTITDGAGQPIELRATAVVGGTAGMTTSGLMRRDALGRTIAGYYPFFTPGASTSFVAPIAALATSSSYDVLDRPLITSYPDGALDVMSYALAASPTDGLMFRSQAVDANGHARETYADLVGRTRAFAEHPTAATSSITGYDYLPTGELSKIVDAEGTMTQLAYDRRGLRVSMANPDTGLITDRYDAMGNHVGMTEPNHRAAGTEVKFRYDRDRLVTIDYPSKPDVTFSYGAVGAAEFRAGRIAQVSDETGSQQYSYGAMGELRRTLRTVVDPAHPQQAAKLFDLRYTSDSFGRQLLVQYPDGERVTTTYNAAGMPAAVTGAGSGWTRSYIDQLRYDVFGNRTHAQFGNGVVSDWTFDPQRIRIASAVTTLPGAGATRVQDLHYLYDQVGNPRSIQNTLPAPPANGKLPGTSGGTFTYDGVDRLTHAIGAGDLPGSKTTTYDLAFAYSASHNLTRKQLQHRIINSAGIAQTPAETNFASDYTYAARPHLPSHVGDNDLTYDPSGNLTRRQATGSQQNYVWDDDGRMVQVTGQGANQRNVFDASGLRVLRDGVGGTTVFASPLYEVANNNAGQKHVFVGAMRIASVFRTYASTATPALPAQPGTAYFFHGDHLGSSGAVTKDDGTLNDAHDYFPDGEIWMTSGPKAAVNGYLFNGKQLDPDTGFYDFGQRFYDPRMSLWLGVDASLTNGGNLIGRPRLLGVASFAANNPVGATDPDGRDFLWKHGDPRAPTFEFVTEQYGPFALAGGVPIVEGPAGGLRKQEEQFATLDHDVGVDSANELLTSMRARDPVTAFGKHLAGLPDRLAVAAHQAANGDSHDARLDYDMLMLFAIGSSGKAGGGLASGPIARGGLWAAEEGLTDLALVRSELGLAAGDGVLTRLDVGGQHFYGINGHGQTVTMKVNAVSAVHAEGDAFQQAVNAGVKADRATLYVDKALCGYCGRQGGVKSMARELNLNEIEVVTPLGRQVIKIDY